jgi:general secretion pathway protein H
MSVTGNLAPTLATACAALPPEGALLAWGGPALRQVAPTLATACAALPPEGALLAWGGPALRRGAPIQLRGFTLLELMVVIAIMAIATAGATLALRDSSVTALEREAQRLAAVLEAGRSLSRTTGLTVHWQPSAEGYAMTGASVTEEDKLQPWLTAGTTAQPSDNRSFVLLGPEPIIPAQSITLGLDGRSLRISTDGLRPFKIDRESGNGQTSSSSSDNLAGTAPGAVIYR